MTRRPSEISAGTEAVRGVWHTGQVRLASGGAQHPPA